MKNLIKKLNKKYEDYIFEINLHTSRQHSFEECCKVIEDHLNRVEEYVYLYSKYLVLDDKSVGGEPMDLWAKFYD